MKIIHLSASNVLRLKAVEIDPDGTFQIIAGRNAQGKSSAMIALSLPTFFNGGVLMLAWLVIGFAAYLGMARMVRKEQ